MDQSMEETKEKKFICKFCSKRFPCGKSLGGHIRTHMINENSAESEAEEEANKFRLGNNNGMNGKKEFGFDSSYDLREYPKRTKRFVDRSDQIASKQQLFCKECGKGFNSPKALCGHMACHSKKEKMVMDDQSDTEDTSTLSRRRSKKVKQKGIVGYSISASSVSGIEQEEQEELAMCLMMLSKDSSFGKGSLSCFGESSDNNSAVLEAKSSSADLTITLENHEKSMYVSSVDENLEIKEQNQNKIPFNPEAVVYSSDNSDSGYFRNGPKKADSEVSVDGFLKNVGVDKPREEFGSRKKSLSRFKIETGFQKDLVSDGAERASTKYDLRKRSKCEFKTDECTESVVFENGETAHNSLEADSCADPIASKIDYGSSKTPASSSKKLSSKKKSKGHECPICFRVFKSGQALGGHKRSHFIGIQENNTVVIKGELTKLSGLIDLNLPAPIDE